MSKNLPAGLIKEVDQTIIAFSPVPLNKLSDGDSLETKVRLYMYQRRALAPPFQRIALKYATSGKSPNVTGVAAEKMKTVKDARTLVSKESGYEYGGE